MAGTVKGEPQCLHSSVVPGAAPVLIAAPQWPQA
jgi:hypothetical protein